VRELAAVPYFLNFQQFERSNFAEMTGDFLC